MTLDSKTRKQVMYLGVAMVLITAVLPLAANEGWYTSITFWSIPFGIGFLLGLALGLQEKRTWKTIWKWIGAVLILAVLSLVLIAGEGALCLIIMGALMLIPFFIGVFAGMFSVDRILIRNGLKIFALAGILMSATSINTYSPTFMVQDALIIEASANDIWEVLQNPIEYGVSDEFFLSNGVSHPTSMFIEHNDGRAMLNVTHNNGSIRSEISKMIPDSLLSFSFHDSLITMRERNFYNDSRTMHLQDHFQIVEGSFRLEPLSDGTCKVIATSRYKHKFEPEWFTNLWVEYFFHQTHNHVLDRVKVLAER